MRIWVARPEPGAARTAARLRALGHAPLTEPVLAVAATGAAPPDGPFAAALLTSGHAAGPLARSGLGLPVLAVGGRTAEQARAAGLAQVTAAGGDAAALAGRVRGLLPPGARLLHAAGGDRKAEPAASLAAAGYAVVAWEVYAARPVKALPEAVAAALAGRSEPIGLVLHYSRRSAAIALDLARRAGLEAAFRATNHACLSADVAVPLVEAGIVAHFVPAQPSEDALLAGLMLAE